MAYYLTVDKGRGKGTEQYEKLNLVNCDCFPNPRLSKTLKGQGMTEEEFDYVSMHFNDELEFRDYLLKNGILKLDDAGRKLTLRQQLKGALVKVRHDFLYQQDIGYVFDPNKLIKRINDKLWLEKDFRFVQSLASNYLSFRECSSTAPEVRYAVTESIRTGNINNMFFTCDENGDELLTRMVKLLIFDHYQNANGKICYVKNMDGTLAKNYHNLHSVIAFVNNYDKKYCAPKIADLEPAKPKTKTLIPQKIGSKKYVLDDQTSLFD